MRKYRGLTKDGKGVKGWYCQIEGQHFIISEDAIHTWQGDSCCIMGVKEVDPKTVGQFTGLHDKKRTKEFPEGQRIYEGDIVRLDTPNAEFHKTRNKEIIFNQRFAQFCIEPCTSISHWPSVEVIGSIHTTPDLMENGK